MTKNYLEQLNERQKEAVLQTKGPVLIIAGAGAGKTKTITARIMHLITEGVTPENILAITFTNKAAKEMKHRVETTLSSSGNLNLPISFSSRPFVSTFHSLGVHILRENSKLMNLPKYFSIFDKSDSKRVIKEALELGGFDPKKYEPAKVQNIISKIKGDMKDKEDIAQMGFGNFFGNLVYETWRRYEEIMKKEEALDFDDLLVKTINLLKNNRDVQEKYHDTWKFIHIDEYQDTNRAQYTISRLLTSKDKNVCVVGDADQTIYSWRGADIKNILDFEKDYPEAKVIFLEENYRSTKNILDVANEIIKKNKLRKEKKLFTKNTEGEKIGVYGAYDEEDEASFIAGRIKNLIDKGVKPEEIAVLYRANFQSRVLEGALLREKLPYQILGVRFFERKEIKDVLSYLKLALNPESVSEIKRVINVPARGIGKTTLLKILSGQENDLPAKTKEKIQDFRSILMRIKAQIENNKTSDIVKFAIKESGLELSFKTGLEEDRERLENTLELVSLATHYDHLKGEEGLLKLLTDASLASDQDDMTKNTETVKLMTVHASKGLEFDYVFIAGIEEDLFPYKRIENEKESDEEDEEERRLFYVALTRARKKVFLSYASVRTLFGLRKVNVPSEFFFDVPNELTQPETNTGGRGAIKTIYF